MEYSILYEPLVLGEMKGKCAMSDGGYFLFSKEKGGFIRIRNRDASCIMISTSYEGFLMAIYGQHGQQRVIPTVQQKITKQIAAAKQMRPGTVHHRTVSRQAAKHVATSVSHLIRSVKSKKSQFKAKTLGARGEEKDSEEEAEGVSAVSRVERKADSGKEGGRERGFQEHLKKGHPELIKVLNKREGLKKQFQKIWTKLFHQAASGSVSSRELAKNIQNLFSSMDEYGMRIVCEHLQEQFERLESEDRWDDIDRLLIRDIGGKERLGEVIKKALYSLRIVYKTLLPEEKQKIKAAFGGVIDGALQSCRSLIELQKGEEKIESTTMRRAIYEMMEFFSHKAIDELVNQIEPLLAHEDGWKNLEELHALSNVMVAQIGKMEKPDSVIELKTSLVTHLLLNAQGRLSAMCGLKRYFSDTGYSLLKHCLKLEKTSLSPILQEEEKQKVEGRGGQEKKSCMQRPLYFILHFA